MTNKHNSFPRQQQRPPSVTPHQVSDEIAQTLMQTPHYRHVPTKDTPAIAVRRDPTNVAKEQGSPRKSTGGKQILKRIIPSRRVLHSTPTTAMASTATPQVQVTDSQETSIDGDLPQVVTNTSEEKVATSTEPSGNFQQQQEPPQSERTARTKRSESSTSVDTAGRETRLSISSESSQSSPSCKKVIFGAYLQKPRRESSTSLSRQEAKLVSSRVDADTSVYAVNAQRCG